MSCYADAKIKKGVNSHVRIKIVLPRKWKTQNIEID